MSKSQIKLNSSLTMGLLLKIDDFYQEMPNWQLPIFKNAARWSISWFDWYQNKNNNNLFQIFQNVKEVMEEDSDLIPSGPKFKCPICQKNFKRKQSLFGHLQSHNLKSGGFKFTCEKCGQSFDNLAQSWKHERIHEKSNRPYVCKICSKSFERWDVFWHFAE